MLFNKLLKRSRNSEDFEIVNEQIEEIKQGIKNGSTGVIDKLSSVQEKLRHSKKVLILEVGSSES